MIEVPFERINVYQSSSFRIAPGRRITTREEAIGFVNERCFIFFWPISGVTFPSLWAAVAGDRPVASEHDDPGHITWSWKDQLLGGGDWYYAKLLRKKATLISMEKAKYFYALTENYGSYEDDYLTLYEQGRISQTERQIYRAILENGPLDTITLKLITHMQGVSSANQFDRAIRDLQTDMMILPVGVSNAGRWHYAFIYDIVARHYPQIPIEAHHISEQEARKSLVKIAIRSLGGVQIRDLQKLFGWARTDLNSAVNSLIAARKLLPGTIKDHNTGDWLFSKELFSDQDRSITEAEDE